MLALPRSFGVLLAATTALVALMTVAAPSAADIKSPGDHPDYSVELEPHFVFQWNETYWADDGIGIGARVSIPLMKNGPIPKINNNIAIGVGFDWVHFGGDCWQYYWRGPNRPLGGWDCDGNQFHVPVVGQWNFFFTPVVSAFGELGLGIGHASFDVGCGPDNGLYCGRYSDTDVNGFFAVGGRFTVGDTVSIVVRLGVPYMSAGVSFLF